VAAWRAGRATSVTVETVALTCLAQGVGIGLFLTPLVTLSLAGLPAERVAAASGLQTAVRMMCGSLMASLAGTFWDERSRMVQNRLADALVPERPGLSTAMDALAQAGFGHEQALAALWRQLQVQADMLALNDFFAYSCVAFALSAALVWLARHPRKAA
jgi:DHA2 family multidrug resistance protein